MKPEQKNRSLPFIIALPLLALLLAGCTHTINPPRQPFHDYAFQEKLPLKVALNITDELRRAKWERHSMGDTWVIPIGDSIAMNAGVLSRHVFKEVVETSNGGAPGSTVDAVLTPKVAYINKTIGATSFGESITTIKLEWHLADAAGKTVWVDTVTGESKGSTGWSDPEDQVKAALESALKKSHQAISSAAAVQQFAARRGS